MEKGVIFHQDSGCPHVAVTTQEKLREPKWDILSHLPYSPELAPSYYHLFRSLQNSWDGRIYETFEDLKNHKIFLIPSPLNFIRGEFHSFLKDVKRL
jgi:histone-lysine N-methyltransferase SETMAR